MEGEALFVFVPLQNGSAPRQLIPSGFANADHEDGACSYVSSDDPLRTLFEIRGCGGVVVHRLSFSSLFRMGREVGAPEFFREVFRIGLDSGNEEGNVDQALFVPRSIRGEISVEIAVFGIPFNVKRNPSFYIIDRVPRLIRV